MTYTEERASTARLALGIHGPATLRDTVRLIDWLDPMLTVRMAAVPAASTLRTADGRGMILLPNPLVIGDRKKLRLDPR